MTVIKVRDILHTYFDAENVAYDGVSRKTRGECKPCILKCLAVTMPKHTCEILQQRFAPCFPELISAFHIRNNLRVRAYGWWRVREIRRKFS